MSNEQAAMSEDTFIEDFWTRRWESISEFPQAESVVHQEEYRLMEPHLQKLPAQSRILDGGCGTGEWAVHLTNQGFNVVGMDLSRTTIEWLRRKLPSYHFVCGDIRHTQFDDASFDAYFSWGVFEHFERGLSECLVEAFRLLKPCGLLFISVPYQNWRHMLITTRDLWKWDHAYDRGFGGYRRPMRFYQWRLTCSELQRELEMHGFRVHSITPIHKLAGVGRLMQWELGWHWNNQWPESLKLLYRTTQHILGLIFPASYISHMIMAIAEKRQVA